MKPFQIHAWIALVAVVGSPIFATAQEVCSFDTITVSSTDDLQQLEKCTTINGSIRLSEDFSGRFILPNVINITQPLYIDLFAPSSNLTSIEMPNVVYMESFGVSQFPALRNISMPKLERIDNELSILLETNITEVDFSSLQRAGRIYLDGIYPGPNGLNFNSLRTVDNDLDLRNCEICLYPPGGATNLSFPALEFVGYLRVAGYISSMSFPELTTAGPPKNATSHLSSGSGLMIHMDHTGLPVDFPKLSSVDNYIKIDENVTSLSMPSLQYTEAGIWIYPLSPLEVNLPLVNATSLLLVGPIKSVELPDLASFESVEIGSTESLDCQSIVKSLKETSGYPQDGSEVHCDARGSSSDGSDGSNRMTLGAKIAIGIIIPVLVILVAMLGFVWRRRRSRNNKGSPSQVELTSSAGVGQERDFDEPPPPYTPR